MKTNNLLDALNAVMLIDREFQKELLEKNEERDISLYILGDLLQKVRNVYKGEFTLTTLGYSYKKDPIFEIRGTCQDRHGIWDGVSKFFLTKEGWFRPLSEKKECVEVAP